MTVKCRLQSKIGALVLEILLHLENSVVALHQVDGTLGFAAIYKDLRCDRYRVLENTNLPCRLVSRTPAGSFQQRYACLSENSSTGRSLLAGSKLPGLYKYQTDSRQTTRTLNGYKTACL